MSSRDPGDVWPYERRSPDGPYDLREPSRAFWCRFSRFLALCYSMDIIVQLEVWATFDYYRDNWAVNPFNPQNNVNYTADQVIVSDSSGSNIWAAVPGMRDFVVVHHTHTYIMQRRAVIDQVHHFLKHGRFRRST